MIKSQEARRRLSRETGTIIKDWGGKIPVAITYPNSYHIGMSNLGIHALYKLLNACPDFIGERAFWEPDQTGQPFIISLESQRPLSDFTVLAFSINYELDYFNVAHVLRASGLPIYATERDESHPLVIAGGPCIIANPMPLAPFFDCLCIGEAEAILPAMFPVLAEGVEGDRQELLKALASLPGLYVPQYHDGRPIVRQRAANLDDFPVTSVVLTPDTELGDLYLIEVERGCARGCRFCLVSNAFRPMRCRSVDSLVAQARLGLKHRKRLGLVGPAVTDHPQIEELLSSLKELGAELSISSLRVKPLPTLALKEVASSGTETVALAPEAGSERLRRVVKKGIGEDDILESVHKVASEGIKHLKLYFMIGLPTETDEDVEEMACLTLKCKAVLDQHQPGCRITLSIAPFVPKASTPFQWSPMESLNILDRRLSLIKSRLMPKGIMVKHESPAWSEVQAVLARGDTKLAGALADLKGTSLAAWRKALAKYQLDADDYIRLKRPTDERLPWSVIDSGTDVSYLKAELDKALRGE